MIKITTDKRVREEIERELNRERDYRYLCERVEAVLICELIFRINSIEDELTLQNEQITYIEGVIG